MGLFPFPWLLLSNKIFLFLLSNSLANGLTSLTFHGFWLPTSGVSLSSTLNLLHNWIEKYHQQRICGSWIWNFFGLAQSFKLTCFTVLLLYITAFCLIISFVLAFSAFSSCSRCLILLPDALYVSVVCTTYSPMACFHLSDWDWCLHRLCGSNNHSCYTSNHDPPMTGSTLAAILPVIITSLYT